MYLDALDEMVLVCWFFELKRSNGVVNTNHDVVVGFSVDIVKGEVSDVLEIKEKSPLEELSLLSCQ